MSLLIVICVVFHDDSNNVLILVDFIINQHVAVVFFHQLKRSIFSHFIRVVDEEGKNRALCLSNKTAKVESGPI